MSLVSNLEAVPNRVWALARLCASEGPLTREDIKDRMVPSGEFANFNLLINETRRLNILTQDGDTFRLSSSVRPRDVSQIDWFIRYVDDALLKPGTDGDASDGNDEVKYALAWLLTCRPGIDIGWTDDQKPRMQEELGGEDYSISNSSRFAMLAYWARFLGYAVGMDFNKRVIVPDPTEAIRRRLNDVFGKDRELTSNEFLARLAELCTVIEGGFARNEVEKRMSRVREEHQISPATSIAVMRLAVDGEIDLIHKADAKIVLLDLMHGDPKRVSHVGRRSPEGKRL